MLSLNLVKNSKILFYNNIIGSCQRDVSNKTIESASGYCLNQVRQYDYENYLCTLLLNDKNRRRSAFAVRSCNVELSRIFSVVSDDKIAGGRLKFWENSIIDMYNKSTIPDHPVLYELKNAIDKYNLSKHFFKRLIITRNRSSNKYFNTIKEMEEYCENVNSSIYYLLFQIYSIKNVNADHAASHLGKAQGIINLLRSIPNLDRRKAIPIPLEILNKNKISEERILRNNKDDKDVQNCVYDIASIAYTHLEKSKKLINELPNDCKILFLPSVAISRYLERLRCVDFHLSNQLVLSRDSMLPLAYFIKKLTKKF